MHFFPEPKARVGVRALCNFASAKQWQGPKFTPQDFEGRFIVGALKGDPEMLGKSFQNLPVGPGNSTVRVDASNYELVPPAWANWAAARIKEKGFRDRVVLTPLPSSKTVAATADYRTLHLARLVQQALGGTAVVWSGVRFRHERQKVHEGGDRSTIADDMILTEPVPDGAIVALDDVYTMGSHLSALMKNLSPERWPTFMICGGRTIWDTPQKARPDEFQHDYYG